jgi:hypothetical protein|tara:strand:+ start:782 stop:1060 length:279 start_codon:yes stop_codon:yes gene_type:complete
MDYYFTTNGEPFTGNTDTGDDAVAKGTAVKKTGIADGTEPWRLSLDGSGNVVIFADGKSETDAQTDKETARTAATAADKAHEKELEDARAAE